MREKRRKPDKPKTNSVCNEINNHKTLSALCVCMRVCVRVHVCVCVRVCVCVCACVCVRASQTSEVDQCVCWLLIVFVQLTLKGGSPLTHTHTHTHTHEPQIQREREREREIEKKRV